MMFQPLADRPLTVILDTTEKCNLKCKMCHFSATDRLQFAPQDRVLSETGMMPLEVFESIAGALFPHAWRVAMACAAEPLIHPRFAELVAVAGRYEVPDLWFPTNLLALTRAKAEAICDAGVTTVGVSLDGTRPETYEAIRVGGRFDRLEKALSLLNEVRRERRAPTSLRIIFTWMRTNRADLLTLPAFAERWGASDIDVRFVTPTPGVDNSAELLDTEDASVVRAELAATARDAVRRGLRLASFPDFESAEDLPRGALGRMRRRRFRRRAGLDRAEYDAYRAWEQEKGCVWPGDFFVIRPNGAVSPCIFWDRDPIGFFPEVDHDGLRHGAALGEILEGLRTGQPVGTCTGCSQRKDAFYYRLRRAQAPPVVETSDAASELVRLGGPT